MDSRVFSADKAVLGVMAFAVALFFELHVAIWWVSRSDSLGDLALLLGMGLVVVGLFSVGSWYLIKTIILYQAGKRAVRENTDKSQSGSESSRLMWWGKVIAGYIVVMAGLAVAGILGSFAL